MPPEKWPHFDGVLTVDGEGLVAASDDFGHLVRRRPTAVLRAGSVDDVVRIVHHAQRAGLRLLPRGAGHTTYGQSQIDGGVVVDLRALDRVHTVTTETVTVDGGISWSSLVNRTMGEGLLPPVLTDFLDVTVGGTLSAGGISGTSFLWGAQIDNVDELVVVTGDGEIVVCSAAREPDLFDAVLGGFGHVGIIVRATLRLTPAPASVEVFRLPYRDPATMVADLRSLAGDGRFDYLLGIVKPTASGGWVSSIEAADGRRGSGGPGRLDGLSHDPDGEEREIRSLVEWVRRVDEPVGVLRQLGLWEAPHPWLDLFVGDAALDLMLSEVRASTVSRGVGPLRILLYPLYRLRFARPMLRLPEEEHLFLLDVLSTAPPGGGEAMVTANRSLFERNRDLGGTVYPISAVPLRPDDWRRQLGPHWPTVIAAKRRFDPDGVLHPGTGLFGVELPV